MIVLIGHGYVGEHIKRELENKGYRHQWLTHHDPIPSNTWTIINAAGFTGSPNVDACENLKKETLLGNVIFPLTLEEKNQHTPIVHITSGCVYTGYTDGGWTENDPPNFDFTNGSFYSGSKALAQEVLMPYMHKSYLLRIRMPFGDDHHDKNFLTKMVKYQKLIDFENSLSYVNDVARIAVEFAITLPRPGIYNVCNPGSKRTKDIVKMMGLNKEWFTEEEFNNFVVAPRSNCVLNTDKLSKITEIQTVDDALITAIRKLHL